MFKEKILTLILAGGKGGRLGLLTDNKAKPVIPFGGAYRLIDFALSNCVNSGISDVWIIEQYELHSLNEHLSNGRPWDLDRTYGGLQVLPPFQDDSKKEGFAKGNADAIYRHTDFIEEFNPDILIVLSADHVYKMDFRDAIQTHLEKGAAVT
ncbi:MAG TPA: sugar phosphate nucleotidyltransferase, partial [Pyrinomonadaceae bacterium]|nr:sugar phosphate nucleotidyltransferase [Pyrinomonadaceae bacterium]